MSDPKPMDPERLADFIRGFTKGMAPWYVVAIGDDVRISRRHPDYKQRADATPEHRWRSTGRLADSFYSHASQISQT
jgi:hypothetical protein